MKSDNEICEIFLGNEEEEIKIFEGYALKIENYAFGVVEDEEIAKNSKVKSKSVILFTKFDENRNDLVTVNEKELIDF